MLTLNDGRAELWQWDTGRTLAVDADCSQVHFSNKVFGRSIDVDVADGVAIIPDILLQTDKDLSVWAFVGTAENGYTKISKIFKVNRRNKPADYVFTPQEQILLKDAIAIVETAKSAANDAIESAEAAETARQGAETAKQGAEAAQSGAELAKTAAETAANNASNYAAEALTAKNEAETSKNATADSAEAAQNSKNAAAQSAEAANTAKTAAQEAAGAAQQYAENAAQSAAAAAESAETLSGTIADVAQLKSDLEAERNARIEADTEHSTRLQKVEVASSVNRYEIDNLKAKAEGKLYRTETVEAEAYTVDVPSSVAPYAEVQRIGGKSVVWNQLRESYQIGTNYGITISSNSDGTINVQGTATSTPPYNQFILLNTIIFKRDGRKYYISSNLNISNGIGVTGHGVDGTKDFIFCRTDSTDWSGSVYINVTEGDVLNLSNLSICIFDLTQMFGSGNDPTLEECKKIFSSDYYPYDAGTIRSFPVRTVMSLNAEGTEIGSIDVSSVTSELKSVPDVYDFWQNGKVTRNVKSITFDGSSDEPWREYNYSDSIKQKHITINDYKHLPNKKNVMCAGYTSTVQDNREGNFNTIYNWTNGVCFNTNETFAEFISRIQSSPITVYYSCIPTEETVPEIDNYIQVEGGGTLTFESDDAVHMPVPSTDRFVVDLTSTTEETT